MRTLACVVFVVCLGFSGRCKAAPPSSRSRRDSQGMSAIVGNDEPILRQRSLLRRSAQGTVQEVAIASAHQEDTVRIARWLSLL